MEKAYLPVSPSFREELEALRDLHKPCEIIFRHEDGARTVIRDRVAALIAREDGEWLRAGSGVLVRLDRLEEVDGMIPSNYC